MSLGLLGVFICVKFHVFEILVDHIYSILCTGIETLETDVVARKIVDLGLQTATFNANFRFWPDSVLAIVQLIILVIVEKYVYFGSILIKLVKLKVVFDTIVKTAETVVTLYFVSFRRKAGYRRNEVALAASPDNVLLWLRLLHKLTRNGLDPLNLLERPDLVVTNRSATSSSAIAEILSYPSSEIEGIQAMWKHLTTQVCFSILIILLVDCHCCDVHIHDLTIRLIKVTYIEILVVLKIGFRQWLSIWRARCTASGRLNSGVRGWHTIDIAGIVTQKVILWPSLSMISPERRHIFNVLYRRHLRLLVGRNLLLWHY